MHLHDSMLIKFKKKKKIKEKKEKKRKKSQITFKFIYQNNAFIKKMQLPFFFRKHYSAFSIQCIPMLFHNTIYFIYNKQRDLEQTYPSPNTQHTNRKRSSECRNSEMEVKSNQRQNKYQAN